MNILFLTMVKIEIDKRDIYNDLMRKFRNEGHEVYIVTPIERREGRPTTVVSENRVHILNVRTLNLQKTNIMEKGFGQMLLEFLYQRAIKKHYGNVKFDLILYSTPPITFTKVIAWAKKQNSLAKSYLMLKDIFPQNAVDLGMLTKSGVKGLLYKILRRKEQRLYEISDYIGCMSPANVKYILSHNPTLDTKKIEICPNSLELVEPNNNEEQSSIYVLNKYQIPTDKIIFIYGGNLGAPQGIPFLIKCLDANRDRNDCHFIIVGSGTYYQELAIWYQKVNPKSITVMKELPKEEYDNLVKSCHVGLIFLDYRFTIPNFPSRLLSYLEYKMPVICATDPNCDEGSIALENGFGLWCPSNDVDAFTKCVDNLLASDIKTMGINGYKFLCNNYLVGNTYDIIMKHFAV